MCFTCCSCQFVFNRRFLKLYCLSVHIFFLVSFTSIKTTLKIISRKFLGVSLIWTFFSHVGTIFFKQPIGRTYRIGKPSNQSSMNDKRPQDIIVRFLSYSDRALVYSNKRNLKTHNSDPNNNYKIYINKALT